MFWVRLRSSIVLVILVALGLYFGGYLLACMLTFISIVGYLELSAVCGAGGLYPKQWSSLQVFGIVSICIYEIALAITADYSLLFVILLGIVVCQMVFYVFTFPKYNSDQIMTNLFSMIYAPVLLSGIYLVRCLPTGMYTVWLIFICSWICDTCAYVVGMLLGKHKLCPKLSPKKSVEGAIGGVVGSGIVGFLYGYFLATPITGREVTIPYVILAMAGAAISQVGDLAASAIKRNKDIKDYGVLIPGHGGIMDRFDSVCFTAPIIFALSYFIL